jgi:hypothetical protein
MFKKKGSGKEDGREKNENEWKSYPNQRKGKKLKMSKNILSIISCLILT